MSPYLQEAYDPESFRRQGHQLIEMLADYLKTVRQGKVLNYVSPEEMYERWEKDFDSVPHADLPGFFSTILRDVIHMHHPQYMGHQTSHILPAATLAELAGSLPDPGMGVYEQGTSGVVLERLIAQKLAGLIGWDTQADGFLTSGGTLGNLTALLCARQVMISSDVWENGYEGRQYGFLVSEEAHYSVGRAIKVMGMGSRGIVPVPVDEQFRMRTADLEHCLQQARSEGITVIGVVASSCSTATGSFDPVDKIADFCEQHRLWLHVDGAHGGCALFSGKYRHLLQGIERADSVIIDFHKMLMTPKLVTALVFRRAQDSYQTFAQKASYLWDQEEGHEWYNLAKRTFELTKSFMSIRVYAIWRTYGTKLFEENVDRLFDAAGTFAGILRSQPDFELVPEVPDCNILCFRYVQHGWEEERTAMVNAAIREQIVKDGTFFIVQTRVRGRLFLRTTIMNPFTEEVHFRALLEKIRQLGESAAAEGA